MHPKDADRMANSVDHDQTAPLEAVWSGANSVDPDQEQSDLGLHCLLRPDCPKT